MTHLHRKKQILLNWTNMCMYICLTYVYVHLSNIKGKDAGAHDFIFTFPCQIIPVVTYTFVTQ